MGFYFVEPKNNAYLSTAKTGLNYGKEIPGQAGNDNYKEATMAKKASYKPVDLEDTEGMEDINAEYETLKTMADEIEEEAEEIEESMGILESILDLAHDLFPKAVENGLERVANYMEEIGPSWEAGCDRIYNKVMNFLDGAEEKTMKSIDKLEASPVGMAINKLYERNHRDDD